MRFQQGRFVKVAPYGIVVHVILTKLINVSISACTFPDLWQNAIVTPVQKSKQNIYPIAI